ncbi:hypothetical protein EJ04DRAFT_511218 [Polyplosphaeria fusca]|uniref:FAD dependent oxidoreductase domain-containing protein n=1 Tax=Polyplosphaeria fusca TaxID=682080 RepID=A0A9P4R0C7_9PLEO|nr:hypothetical protein EJ04DRAFT_511218 [Polyplosphaeria fusca]
MADVPDPTVILGGGIIGLSTAYYLSLQRQGNSTSHSPDNAPIFVVEPSSDVCAGPRVKTKGF